MSGTRIEWTESAGGPLIAMPRSVAATWMGIETGDYDDACAVEGYLERLSGTHTVRTYFIKDEVNDVCLVLHRFG
ncbi:Imm21 family immunity protein [Pyxidicoccus fallax]|uniref:Imm21 family immunity protein n=1 Tax=Pyxidicoccus fallax TaxID=394095 RepID=UPI0031B5B289